MNHPSQVILLDESTPILAVLIVDGGRVIWDRAHGIHLQSEYVIVTNDGSFEIGTEDNFFCHDVIISGLNYSDFVTAYGAYFTAQLLDTHGVNLIYLTS